MSEQAEKTRKVRAKRWTEAEGREVLREWQESGLSAVKFAEAGFSLHAAKRAGAADEQGREALLKYILRPPLSTERLVPGPDGLVRIALKKPFSDGTVAVDLDPLPAALPPSRSRPSAALPHGTLLGRPRCRLEMAAPHRAQASADRSDGRSVQ